MEKIIIGVVVAFAAGFALKRIVASFRRAGKDQSACGSCCSCSDKSGSCS